MCSSSLFFTLIQIAVGRKERFDGVPTAEEWNAFFSEAKKQAMTGVLFRAIERVPKEQQPGTSLKLQWYIARERIVHRNIELNRLCIALIQRLQIDGMRPCLLKGPGIASLYDEALCRMPGDIDLWLDMPKRQTIAYVRQYCGGGGAVCPHHIGFPVIKGISVELHFSPAVLMNPWTNRRLQHFFRAQIKNVYCHRIALLRDIPKPSDYYEYVSGQVWKVRYGEETPLNSIEEAQQDEYLVVTPTSVFNAVFLLVHIFKHFINEGVGMRQIMDYYYLLMCGLTEEEKKTVAGVLRQLHLTVFAGAMMYVLDSVFGMEKDKYVASEDVKEGKVLLHTVMDRGDFGQYAGTVGHEKSRFGNQLSRYLKNIPRSFHLLCNYPVEVAFAPLYNIYFFLHLRWYRL